MDLKFPEETRNCLDSGRKFISKFYRIATNWRHFLTNIVLSGLCYYLLCGTFTLSSEPGKTLMLRIFHMRSTIQNVLQYGLVIHLINIQFCSLAEASGSTNREAFIPKGSKRLI